MIAHAEKIKELVFNDRNKILAYGSSARSSTLLNFCGINSEHVSVVIDKNPLKEGFYTAGSNIPIISFEDGIEIAKKSSEILLLAWNFQDEITNELKKIGFKGNLLFLSQVVRVNYEFYTSTNIGFKTNYS